MYVCANYLQVWQSKTQLCQQSSTPSDRHYSQLQSVPCCKHSATLGLLSLCVCSELTHQATVQLCSEHTPLAIHTLSALLSPSLLRLFAFI